MVKKKMQKAMKIFSGLPGSLYITSSAGAGLRFSGRKSPISFPG
jgi:hypothetical protein